jgi:excisionase family DNA binding protein
MSLMSTSFVSPEDIARHLRVTRRTVYRWIEAGELRAYKAGKHWRITEQDLEDFLRWKGPGWHASVRVSERVSDRALDAEISEAVVGYQTIPTPEGWRQVLPTGERRELPAYSSNPADGQFLAEEVKKLKGWELRVSPPGGQDPELWFALLFIGNKHVCGAAAPTRELAVCRVLLKWHFIEKREQLWASMPTLATGSETLIREDRDQR